MKSKRNFSPQAHHVFISTHPDDWQLFMGEYAYDAMSSPSTKVLLLIMNAGDAGKGDRFWQAREEGSFASVRSVSGFSVEDRSSGVASTFVSSTNHRVEKRVLRNMSVYNLRLPDGLIKGTGTSDHEYTSIYKLYLKKISEVKTVDEVNTFTLENLKSTIQEILDSELKTSNEIVFYLQDSGTQLSFSHSDHWATQALVEDVIKTMKFSKCRIKAFEDYRTVYKTRNLSGEDIQKKKQLLNAYDLIASPETQRCSTCDWVHRRWIETSFHKEFEC